MKAFMQLQFGRTLLLLSAAFYGLCADAGKALPLNLVAMEQTILKLSRSGKTNNQTLVTINAMRNLVNTFLAPHLAKMHDDDQDLMNTADAPFNACESDHMQYINGTLQNLSYMHQSCREEESRLKGVMELSCGTTRDTKTQAFIAGCEVFAGKDVLPGELPGACKKVTATTNEDEALRLRDYFTNLKADWQQWKDHCDTVKNNSKTANETCEADTQAYVDKTAECDAAQDKLDYAVCWQHRLGTCDQFSRCWAEARSSYTSLNASVVSAMAARKTEYAGLQRILCYLNALETSTNSGTDVSAGISACDAQSVDTSAYDVTLMYYAETAPLLPTQPECSSLQAWPKPGTAEYIAQEYAVLPADAPAKDCVSVCCTYCNHFPCPNSLYQSSAGHDPSCPADPENIKAFSLHECCALDVTWRPDPWTNTSCNSSCGQSATVETRLVPCADAAGTVYADSACANYTKPETTKTGCPATAACVTCVAAACNTTGQYLNNCGGFGAGYCAACATQAGLYITGFGGTVNQDSCPTVNCSTHAVCATGSYLNGCGGLSPGTCQNCTDNCLIGYYSHGCGGQSAGTCMPCTIPPGYLASSAGDSSGLCNSVQETAATASTSTGVALDMATWALDKDSARHSAVISGSEQSWIRLTDLCERSDVTTGSISYTLPTQTDKSYKIKVEAAWRPVSGLGVKSNYDCNTGAGSVLQLSLVGSGNDDTPTGANVTACFDQVTHTSWSTVWFEFAPTGSQVTMKLSESFGNCLSVKSVSYYAE